ncbi:MAG: peptide chain release factor N(5)-glutamine methyltransferase [Corynebacterium sp.]|nr:peptide chain release factor N(5)-glutamine methyltransferase [Corynebacterium sp.]
MPTIAAALVSTRFALESAGIPSAKAEAEILVSWVRECGRMELFLQRDATLSDEEHQRLEHAIAQRITRVPLQHIMGVANFYGYDFVVGPGVFIPRPETEMLAAWAVQRLCNLPHPVVVDLCTGSGALAATVAYEVTQAAVSAVEISEEAAAYARLNLPETVNLVLGDATQAETYTHLGVPGSVDLVVSNPPYVPTAAEVSPEVHQDPPQAVFSGESGMDVIHAMLPHVVQLLKPGGYCGIEHDDATQDLVIAAFESQGLFEEITPIADDAGRARFVTARKVVE